MFKKIPRIGFTFQDLRIPSGGFHDRARRPLNLKWRKRKRDWIIPLFSFARM